MALETAISEKQSIQTNINGALKRGIQVSFQGALSDIWGSYDPSLLLDLD